MRESYTLSHSPGLLCLLSSSKGMACPEGLAYGVIVEVQSAAGAEMDAMGKQERWRAAPI